LGKIIKKSNTIDADEMLGAIVTLDKIVQKKRDCLPKRLVHFLERRSYEKALTWIEETKKIGN